MKKIREKAIKRSEAFRGAPGKLTPWMYGKEAEVSYRW
jgi:hypothetical protein